MKVSLPFLFIFLAVAQGKVEITVKFKGASGRAVPINHPKNSPADGADDDKPGGLWDPNQHIHFSPLVSPALESDGISSKCTDVDAIMCSAGKWASGFRLGVDRSATLDSTKIENLQETFLVMDMQLVCSGGESKDEEIIGKLQGEGKVEQGRRKGEKAASENGFFKGQWGKCQPGYFIRKIRFKHGPAVGSLIKKAGDSNQGNFYAMTYMESECFDYHERLGPIESVPDELTGGGNYLFSNFGYCPYGFAVCGYQLCRASMEANKEKEEEEEEEDASRRLRRYAESGRFKRSALEEIKKSLEQLEKDQDEQRERDRDGEGGPTKPEVDTSKSFIRNAKFFCCRVPLAPLQEEDNVAGWNLGYPEV